MNFVYYFFRSIWVYRVIVYLARASEHKFVVSLTLALLAFGGLRFHCTNITEVVGSNLVKPELSFFFYSLFSLPLK